MIARLLLQEAIGETRAVALDRQDRAVASFHDRWAERGKRLRWGDVLPGLIRSCSKADGGVFVELENGAEGFYPKRDMGGLVEGARHDWRVAAEARTGKLAKLAEAEAGGDQAADALARWQASLPGGAGLDFDTTEEAARRIDDAIDDALSSQVQLPGGGRLQITPTPALIAVDVDTVGRRDTGRASTRAQAVNIAAAEEIARQSAMRNLGGALVLDCISPIARRDGPDIKTRFAETFSTLSSRRAECLAPSPFGLMEVVLERRWRPLSDAYLEADGKVTPIAMMLWGLRDIERAAKINRADRLALHLPGAAFEPFNTNRDLYEKALKDRFGSRIEVVITDRDKPDVVTL